jgi:hypothetical protein
LWYGNWSLLHSPFESFWCNPSRTSQLPNRASHFFLHFVQVTISNPVGPAVSNRYLPNQLLQLTGDRPNQLLRRARVVSLCNSNLARGASSCEKTETLRNSTVTDSFKKIAKLSWRYHMICNQEAYTAMMFRNSTMLLAWQPGPAGLLYQVLPVRSGVHSVLISSRSLSSQNDLGRKHQKETQATKPAWHKFHHLARHTEQKLQL